jgi:hypothetical protein
MDTVAELKSIWLLFDQPCSKLLHPVLASYVASYEKHQGCLGVETKKKLLQMSPSTIDRLLRPHRVRTSLWRGRGGPIAIMKAQVPVRSERWDGRGTGWLEADTVAHSGGSMEGCFAHTLTVTDTETQWTELRAMWNKGGHATMQRMEEIELSLPFSVKGINTDNGPEFLNGHLIRYFKDRDVVIPQSRSRPYQKNDNAHVEQKNGSLVRALLGYDRFDDPEGITLLNEILVLHSCWVNLFRPCMKLISKVKEGHRYKKKYDAPMTPAQRALKQPGLEKSIRDRINQMMADYDCYALKRLVHEKLQNFFQRHVHADAAITSLPEASPGPSALRAAPSGAGPGLASGRRRSHHKPKRSFVRINRQEKPSASVSSL